MANPSSLRMAACLAPALAAGACALAPGLPAETGPTAFVIERDLAGDTVATGKFSAINGVNRPFTAKLNGKLDGKTFRLVEDFAFEDGEKDQKTWVLTFAPDGSCTGVREDVVGVAKCWRDGLAFRLAYDVRLNGADGKPGMKVHFQDVMVKRADGTVINNASVGKWGFGVGKVQLQIRRAEAMAATAPKP